MQMQSLSTALACSRAPHQHMKRHKGGARASTSTTILPISIMLQHHSSKRRQTHKSGRVRSDIDPFYLRLRPTPANEAAQRRCPPARAPSQQLLPQGTAFCADHGSEAGSTFDVQADQLRADWLQTAAG